MTVDEMNEIAELQDLLDTGLAWKLEGHVGRTCKDAIDAGYCMLGHEGHVDYWGNYVPSRYEVEPGTPGSPEHAGVEIERNPLMYKVRFADGTEHEIDSPQLFGVFSKMHLNRFGPVEILGEAA